MPLILRVSLLVLGLLLTGAEVSAQTLVGATTSNAGGVSSNGNGVQMRASVGGPPAGVGSSASAQAAFGGPAGVQATGGSSASSPGPALTSGGPSGGGGGGCTLASPAASSPFPSLVLSILCLALWKRRLDLPSGRSLS